MDYDHGVHCVFFFLPKLFYVNADIVYEGFLESLTHLNVHCKQLEVVKKTVYYFKTFFNLMQETTASWTFGRFNWSTVSFI